MVNKTKKKIFKPRIPWFRDNIKFPYHYVPNKKKKRKKKDFKMPWEEIND